MPRFKFRLESLKKFRDRRLLVAKKDLLEVESRRQDLLAEIERVSEERRSVLGWNNGVNFGEALYLGGLPSAQGQKISEIRSRIQKIDEEIERHRSWVAHLSKELRAVERLEEKKRQIFDENTKRLERRFQDGWVVERWTLARDPEVDEGSDEL